MPLKTPKWEESAAKPSIKILRLYETELNPEWPKIAILNLTADQFKEFDRDPLAFDKTYNLFPGYPITSISHCGRRPHAKSIPEGPDLAPWTVVILKAPGCGAASIAGPHESP
jgi:hypothetical protein